MEIVKEQAMAGYPSRLSNVCLVYPGMMRDMLQMGRDIYEQNLGLLLLTQQDVERIIREKGSNPQDFGDTHPLTYLLKNADVNDMFLLELTAAFSTFIKEEVLLLPPINAVLIGPMAEKRLITKDNFEDFQMILRLQNRKEVPKPPPENESDFARELRLKAEMRDAVKRKQQQKEGAVQELADLLEIARVYGINYKEESIYAFYGLIQRFQRKEKWDRDMQMLCAGADSQKVKPEYWGETPKD